MSTADETAASYRSTAAMLPASREAFYPTLLEHALRTARVVRLFEDKDLDLRPGPGSLSTAEQINHICACYNFLRQMFVGEADRAAFGRTYDVSSVAAALKSMESALGEVREAAAGVSAERWEEQVSPFGPAYAMTRGQMAYLFVEHDVHHGGQLHVYARMAGKVPPFLYDPVHESILTL